jgi:ParB family chromosome partitioning protein
MTTDITIHTKPGTIPLNLLVPCPENVRRTSGRDEALPELAASILAHGVLQSLNLRKSTGKANKGKFEVVAGGRRLKAMTMLVEAGKIPADWPVPFQMIADDANVTEISLAENAVREDMHPADEFDAFLALTKNGKSAEDIAASFGVTPAVVERRLRLARVSPVIMKAFRKDKIGLAHVMAFAVTDDHQAQEHLFASLDEWHHRQPNGIRKALTEGEITASDRRVKFVTVKSYEKAGGKVRRDLFTEGDNGIFIEDSALLETLARAKLENIAAKIRKEGWKWVEVRASYDHSEWSKFGREEAPPLPPEQQQELDALNAEFEKLGDSEDGDEWQRYDEIERRICMLEDREKSWTPETLAIAGAVVSIGHRGELDIHRGLVRPEDMAHECADDGEGDYGGKPKQRPAIPASLTESLTTEKSAAITATMIGNLDIGFAAVVHAIALPVFYRGRGKTCLQITTETVSLQKVQDTAAVREIERARKEWVARLPEDSEGLWSWCLEQTHDVLVELLVFCGGCAVDAVQCKTDHEKAPRLAHAGQLAEALHLEMAVWFRPSAANYFGKVGKPMILEALREIKGGIAPSWEKMKKAELANFAELQTVNSTWLPPALRSPDSSAQAAPDAPAQDDDGMEEAA